MKSFLAIATLVLEVLAVVAIVLLWRRRDLKKWSKVIWTLILLIPIFGLLLYCFISTNPEPHNVNSDIGGFA